MTETIYSGATLPVKVAATVLPRLQEYTITTDRTVEQIYEMGNQSAAGTSSDSWRYAGKLMYYPISTLVERAIIGQAGTATYLVTLEEFMNGTPLTVDHPVAGLGGAVVTGVEYSVSVPNGKWQCSMDLKATSLTGGTATSAPAVAGVGAYRAKHIYARFESLASTLLRVKSITVTARYNAEDEYQLSTADPFAIFNSQPNVSAQIEWYWSEDSAAPGTLAFDYRPILEDASGEDIEIQVVPTGSSWDSAGNIQMILANMTTDKRNYSGRAAQRATQQIGYMSGGDATTYGMSLQIMS